MLAKPYEAMLNKKGKVWRYQGEGGHSETVYRRNTDNTVAKRKSTMVDKTLHRKQDWASRPLLKTGVELMFFGRGSSSCTTSGAHRVIVKLISYIYCCSIC